MKGNKIMEEWRNISGFNGIYQVSNLGRVRSRDRTEIDSLGRVRKYKGKIMKLRKKENGYYDIHLNTNFYIHRLVAATFLDNKGNLPCVHHKDFDKNNNTAANLDYVTYSQNIQSSYDFEGHWTKKIQLINKLTQEVINFDKITYASEYLGYAKSYLTKNITRGRFENEKYIWKLVH